MPSAVLSPDNDYNWPAPPGAAKMTREEWNAFGTSLGGRLRALESVASGIETVLEQLQTLGLSILDEAINPLIAETQAELAQLAADIQTQITAINGVVAAFQEETDQIIADFQAVTAVNLEDLADQISAAEASLAAVQAQIETFLAGGIPTDVLVGDLDGGTFA